MPVASVNLEFRLAAPDGDGGNTAVGVPGNSLGRYVSQTPILSAVVEQLFPNDTGAEAIAGTVDYQCAFLFNKDPLLGLANVKVWTSAAVTGGAIVAIAVDNQPATSINQPPTAPGSSTSQATQIANKTTAPVGVSAFSAPTTLGTALALGNIGPNKVKAFWVRRTATTTPFTGEDGITLNFSADSDA